MSALSARKNPVALTKRYTGKNWQNSVKNSLLRLTFSRKMSILRALFEMHIDLNSGVSGGQ
jgi:hypothetical protein